MTNEVEEPCKVCEGLCCGEIPRLMQKAAADEAALGAIAVWLEQNQPDVFRRGLWDAICEARKGPFQLAASAAKLPVQQSKPRFSQEGKFVFDDDFGYDAKLKVDGDWPDDGHRDAYLEAVCKALNSGTIPALKDELPAVKSGMTE